MSISSGGEIATGTSIVSDAESAFTTCKLTYTNAFPHKAKEQHLEATL